MGVGGWLQLELAVAESGEAPTADRENTRIENGVIVLVWLSVVYISTDLGMMARGSVSAVLDALRLAFEAQPG